jgi:hypothetical protein
MSNISQKRLTDDHLTIRQLSLPIGYSPQFTRNIISSGAFLREIDYVELCQCVLFQLSPSITWFHGEHAIIDIPVTHGF